RSHGNFRVNLENGGFICFSCGAKGGDFINFLMKRDSIDFREALEKLANEWGIK
ncbi:MAG: DNA primase, partial [Magnetococcales bacterium]|nr:DNA primase [Magnetococcales bacterium]